MDDLREMLRRAAGKEKQPTAVIYDGQTLQGAIESGERVGYDGHKRKNGSKSSDSGRIQTLASEC